MRGKKQIAEVQTQTVEGSWKEKEVGPNEIKPESCGDTREMGAKRVEDRKKSERFW